MAKGKSRVMCAGLVLKRIGTRLEFGVLPG
jgi:hypothetical protein